MKKLKGLRLSTYSKHLQKLAQNYCRTAKTKLSSELLSNCENKTFLAKTKHFSHEERAKEGNYYLMQEPYYGSCLMSLSMIFASKQ